MFEYNKLYFIDTQSNTGEYNMWFDETLFNKLINDDFNLPVLRLYTWSEDTISIGYNQTLLNSVQLPIRKRITGGQAVFHSTSKYELTYSFLIRTDLKPRIIYKDLGEIFISLLKKYSLNANFGYKNIDYRESFNCFESMTEADIVVNNIKIIGSAQRVKRKNYNNASRQYILQHGSIKLDKIKELSKKEFSTDIFKNDIKNFLLIDKQIDLINLEIKERYENNFKKVHE